MRRATILICALAVSLGVVPAPSPTPPIIARVTSRPLCSALRSQAGPAIAGLILNDKLTQSAVPVLNRFYNDRANKSARADFDITAMRDVASRMAHNIETIDAILATLPTPAPSAVPGADDVKVAAIRKQLNDVEDAQRGAINVISGLAETQAMADLQNRPNGLMGADGPTGAAAATPLPDGWAGLPPTPTNANDPRVLMQGNTVGANAETPYVQALGARAAIVTQREEVVSSTLLRAAKECGAQANASASPSATPSP